MALKLAASGKLDTQALQNKLLNIMKHPNWKIKLIAINAITEVIANKALVNFNLKTAKKIIDIVQWHITDDNLKQEVGSLLILIQNSIKEESVQVSFQEYLASTLGNQLQIFYQAKRIEEFPDIR